MLFLGSGDQLPDLDQPKKSLDMNEENGTVENETSKAEILQKGEKKIINLL